MSTLHSHLSRSSRGNKIYINVVLIYSFFYFYSNGFILLHYKIMLGTHKEENSMDLNKSNVNFSNNVYLVENMVKHV